MKLYQFVGGAFNGLLASENKANEIFKTHGRGHSEDFSELRNKGRLVPREELDNELLFKGYLSPMWGGEGFIVNGVYKPSYECTDESGEKCYIVRYETQEAYDFLSR